MYTTLRMCDYGSRVQITSRHWPISICFIRVTVQTSMWLDNVAVYAAQVSLVPVKNYIAVCMSHPPPWMFQTLKRAALATKCLLNLW